MGDIHTVTIKAIYYKRASLGGSSGPFRVPQKKLPVFTYYIFNQRLETYGTVLSDTQTELAAISLFPYSKFQLLSTSRLRGTAQVILDRYRTVVAYQQNPTDPPSSQPNNSAIHPGEPSSYLDPGGSLLLPSQASIVDCDFVTENIQIHDSIYIAD